MCPYFQEPQFELTSICTAGVYLNINMTNHMALLFRKRLLLCIHMLNFESLLSPYPTPSSMIWNKLESTLCQKVFRWISLFFSGNVILENISKWPYAMVSFFIISLIRDYDPSFEQIWILLIQGWIVLSLIESGPVVLEFEYQDNKWNGIWGIGIYRLLVIANI